MGKIFRKDLMISDVVKWENNPQYTRGEMTVTANETDVVVKCGTPYVKSTATKITPGSDEVPAAWTAVLEGKFEAAKPEVYTIKIGGTWAVDDTLVIGSTTFTAKANPTTSNQFSANGTGETIVEDIAACSLVVTGYTITYSGDTITLTQTVPGTGDAPTVTPTSTAGTAVLSNVQNYKAADTFTINATTITVVEGTPSDNQVTAGDALAVAAAIVALDFTYSGYTITAGEGASIVFTQSTASSTENAPTFSASSSTGSVTTTKTQSYKAAESNNISSIDCIALYNITVPAGTTMKTTVLERGPCIYDPDNLLEVGDKKEDVITRLKALNMIPIYEPEIKSYQET